MRRHAKKVYSTNSLLVFATRANINSPNKNGGATQNLFYPRRIESFHNAHTAQIKMRLELKKRSPWFSSSLAYTHLQTFCLYRVHTGHGQTLFVKQNKICPNCFNKHVCQKFVQYGRSLTVYKCSSNFDVDFQYQ